VGLQVLLQSGLVVVLAVDGAVRLYIDCRLEASGDGLRKLKGFSPANVNSNRAQNFVGRWMRPDQSTALHASLLSLAHNV
jgi:hypothetical protein